jgi:hypothetical protein
VLRSGDVALGGVLVGVAIDRVACYIEAMKRFMNFTSTLDRWCVCQLQSDRQVGVLLVYMIVDSGIWVSLNAYGRGFYSIVQTIVCTTSYKKYTKKQEIVTIHR